MCTRRATLTPEQLSPFIKAQLDIPHAVWPGLARKQSHSQSLKMEEFLLPVRQRRRRQDIFYLSIWLVVFIYPYIEEFGVSKLYSLVVDTETTGLYSYSPEGLVTFSRNLYSVRGSRPSTTCFVAYPLDGRRQA